MYTTDFVDNFQQVVNLVELELPPPVISTVIPFDSTWSHEQPRDDDSAWPIMYGDSNNGYGYNPSNGHHYSDDGGFPTLRNGGRAYQSNGFPPGSAGPASSFNTSAYAPPPQYGQYGAPSQYGGASQHGPQSGPPPRNFTMTPMLSGNSGFNPSAPRYVPTHMRDKDGSHMVDPIVRPESSISNHTFASNNTFATQLPPRQHMPDMAAPVPRRNYQAQAFGNGMNGLGAGLEKMNIGRHQGVPSTINEGNDSGLNSQNGALARRSDGGSNGSRVDSVRTPSSRYLAEEIMDGKTEDPYDRKMKRYDLQPKQAPPVMGPARFKDTKMFSVADGTSNGDVQTFKLHVRQELPPAPKPDWLDLAMRGMMKPNLEEAFDALPFAELPRTINPPTAGVIKIADIPYTSSKQELTAFVGRQAQINRMPEGSPYHAVHIIMERESGKTQDCFIELATPNEAAWVVRQINKRLDQGRPPKVGDRIVKVTNSSQDELMTELFPRAKHVRWHQGQPIVDQSKRTYYEKVAADGFSGFLHDEEFHAMQKHANLDERAPFSSKSPCRVYEAMISLLYKYPWYAVELVYVRERRSIYDTATGLIRNLCARLRNSNNKFKPLDPTPALLQELVSGVLYCPGFSERQKSYASDIVKTSGFNSIAQGRGVNIPIGGAHQLASHWPFAALSVHPGVDYKLVEYYAGLFREASSATKPNSGMGSLAARQMAKSTGYESGPMGNFKINYGNADKLTLADLSKAEYAKIEQLLSIVCPRPGQEGKHPSAPNSIGPDYSNGRGSSGSSAGAHSLF